MTNATLDRLLAVLVVAMAVTGLLSLRAGSPAGAWVFVLHGLLGGSLAAAVALKVRRSVPRAVRSRRAITLALGLIVAAAASAALAGGFAWVAGGSILTVGTWTVLTLHAWIGLVVVPLVVVHLLPRRWRLLRPGRHAVRRAGARLSRRSALTGIGLAAVGATGYGLANLIERWSGGERRFTGSRLLPSGGIPPVTTFFGEPTPPIDLAAWRVRVDGLVGAPGSLSVADLRAFGETDLTAILDCTSGWALETGWHGVPLGTVLAAVRPTDAAREVTVRSVTGWSVSLQLAEARNCLLATGVAGQTLPAGNGAPIRLVVPDRRGLDWVKWVDRIEIA
jgi:DMSO/TMAO reductase YedYZ molybdopterin-dependent catalytic subunit